MSVADKIRADETGLLKRLLLITSAATKGGPAAAANDRASTIMIGLFQELNIPENQVDRVTAIRVEPKILARYVQLAVGIGMAYGLGRSRPRDDARGAREDLRDGDRRRWKVGAAGRRRPRR